MKAEGQSPSAFKSFSQTKAAKAFSIKLCSCTDGEQGQSLLLKPLQKIFLQEAYMNTILIIEDDPVIANLEKDYLAGKFEVLTEDEYINILKECVRIIPETTVIHRLTGDGDKKLLVAPLWSGDKKHMINRIRKEVLT